MVVVADYATIDHIVTRQTDSFDRAKHTSNVFRTIIPTGQISLQTNDMWKHHRRLIGTAMTSKYLSLTTPRANEAIGELIELWKVKSHATSRAWAAEQDMESATMDAICEWM